MEKIRKQIIEMIKRSQSILVMPSSPPDGDSLGAALALYWILKKLDKQVTVVCADPIPEAFQFLPTTTVISNEFSAARDFIVTLDCQKAQLKSIRSKLEHDKVNIILTAKKGQFSKEDVSFHYGPSRYDLIITVDTADLEQLGRFYEDNTDLFTSLPLINIDHHASNGNFGRINLVDVMSSATTELMIPLVHEMEQEFGMRLMDEDTATLLLAGIITDTGSFQNANTTPRSFAAAAQLIKEGARQQEIIQNVFKTKQLSTLRLWGRILSNMKVDPKYRMAWSVIAKRDLVETGSREDETGGIIDELMTNAPGTEIVFLLKEKAEGLISGSIRTTTAAVDASAIAEMFGGGGHVQAAGFKYKSNDPFAVEKLMVEKIRQYQKERLHLNEEVDESIVVKTSETFYENIRQEVAGRKVEVDETVVSEDIKNEVDESAIGETSRDELMAGKDDFAGTKTYSVNGGEGKQKGKEKRSEDVEATFIDQIIKKAPDEASEEVEMEEGITYKFEE